MINLSSEKASTLMKMAGSKYLKVCLQNRPFLYIMYNLFINPVHCSLFTHESKDVKRKGYATTSTSRSKSGLRVIKSNKWDQIDTQIDVNNWKVLFILEKKNPVELTLCGCLQPFSNLLLNPSLRYFDLCILDRTSAAHEVFPFIPR